MSSDQTAPRLLGATFLAVVLTSLCGSMLGSSALGSGGIAQILVNASKNTSLLQASVLLDLLTSVGVVVLACLLYVVLRQHGAIVALIAFGCWLGEAFALAFSKVGTLALIPLGQDFVKAGSPDSTYYESLGRFLYSGLHQQLGSTTHMLFYCLGGILWYSLFFKSRYVPRVISAFGVAAVAVGLAGIVLQFLGRDVSIFVFLPILPFELAIGTWLLARGKPAVAMTGASAASRPQVAG